MVERTDSSDNQESVEHQQMQSDDLLNQTAEGGEEQQTDSNVAAEQDDSDSTARTEEDQASESEMAEGGEETLEDIDQYIIPLSNRGVVAVYGKDARDFLQRILTNDIEKVTEELTQYSALLTPQGKFLFDFFICQMGDDTLLLDCDAASIPEIIETLEKYKLQSEVGIKNVSENFHVMAILGDGTVEAVDPEMVPGKIYDFGDGIVYIDPRLPAMQLRVLFYYKEGESELPGILTGGFIDGDYDLYEYLRLWVGVPDTSRDMVKGKSFPFDYGFKEMNCFAFEKGCYIGQEVITRFNQKGTVKNKLFPVRFDGNMPKSGEAIIKNEKPVGKFCSGIDDIGIALLNIKEVEDVQKTGTKVSTKEGLEIILDEGAVLDEAVAQEADSAEDAQADARASEEEKRRDAAESDGAG